MVEKSRKEAMDIGKVSDYNESKIRVLDGK